MNAPKSEHFRWIAGRLRGSLAADLLPAMLLDRDGRRLAIGLVTPDNRSDRRSFWPDVPAIEDFLIQRAAALRYEDEREDQIFDVHLCPSMDEPRHIDFRIRAQT